MILKEYNRLGSSFLIRILIGLMGLVQVSMRRFTMILLITCGQEIMELISNPRFLLCLDIQVSSCLRSYWAGKLSEASSYLLSEELECTASTSPLMGRINTFLKHYFS